MYYNIADVVKNAFTDKDEHLTKAFQKEKHAKGICEQKLESSLIKSLSEKLINSVLFCKDGFIGLMVICVYKFIDCWLPTNLHCFMQIKYNVAWYDHVL